MLIKKGISDMKTKKQRRSIPADIGVFLLVTIFPLFITNKYNNITISKFAFFMTASVTAFFVCLIFCEPNKKDVTKKKIKNKADFINHLKSCDKLSLSFVLFLICGILAMLVSPYPFSAFCGYAGRYMGFDFIIAVFLTYIWVTRYFSLNETTIAAFECSGILVFILAVIQFLGFNPFNLKEGITHEKLSTFISTIGNVNVFASFISLVLPVALYIVCFSENRKLAPIYMTASVLGFIGVFISNSDSAYLALIFAFWLLTLLSFENSTSFHRVFAVFAAFFLTAFLFGRIHSLFENAYHLSTLTVYLTKPYSIIPAVFFALICVALRLKPLSEKAMKGLKYAYIVISALTLFSVLTAMVYFSAFDKKTDLGALNAYLRFNDSWGTERGLVWRLSLSAFKEMPFINKLFGYGEDTVVMLLAKYFKQEMLASGYYTNNAHNELLQYLLTMGIFGVLSYISILIFSMKKLLTKRKKSVLFGAIAVAVFAYAGQSLVNITQPITTPLMFLMMSFAGCEINEKISEKSLYTNK